MGEVLANCQHFNLNAEILKGEKHTDMNIQTQRSQESESKWISQCSELCGMDDDISGPSNYRISTLKPCPMIRMDLEV
jgi:hypothetical protein